MKTPALATAIVLLSAGLAHAGARQPVFEFSAEDLTTLEGITHTHQRIEHTARAYCRDYLHGTRGVRMRNHCRTAVEGEIVDSIGDPRLSAYARTGKVAKELLARR